MSCFLQSNVTLESGSPVPNTRFFYEFNNVSAAGVNYLVATFYPTWDIAFNTDSFDYYVNIYIDSSSADSFTFFPDKISVRRLTASSYLDTQLREALFNDFYGKSDSGDSKGFHILAKLPDNFNFSIRGFNIVDSTNGTIPANLNLSVTIIQAQKDSTLEYVQSIIDAIEEQTDTLGNKLDNVEDSVNQAADDITKSIENQYSGDPETKFSIDDVISQHNEKMGVLSFGSDVMVQFLDLFQSANAGTAELTLPGFNITVQNVEYQVWPDYSFNFNQIDEWVPGLMSIVRVILPAFVWLKVLGYCISVFEKNFLSNNGG